MIVLLLSCVDAEPTDAAPQADPPPANSPMTVDRVLLHPYTAIYRVTDNETGVVCYYDDENRFVCFTADEMSGERRVDDAR